MKRREFLGNSGALLGGAFTSGSEDIDSGKVRRAVRSSESYLGEPVAGNYVLFADSENNHLFARAVGEVTPDEDFLKDALYTQVDTVEAGLPDQLDQDFWPQSEVRDLNVYLAEPALSGQAEGWEENLERELENTEFIYRTLLEEAKKAEREGYSTASGFLAQNGVRALENISAVEEGLRTVEAESFSSPAELLKIEPPSLGSSGVKDYTSDGDFSAEDVFRFAYLKDSEILSDLVPHVADYSGSGDEPGQADTGALLQNLLEENPGEVSRWIEKPVESGVPALNTFGEEVNTKRENQQSIDIHVYSTPVNQVFREPAKELIEGFLGTFYHDSMYNVDVMDESIELESESSEDKIWEFQNKAGQGEHDYQILLDRDPVGIQRLIAGKSQLDQLFDDQKTASGIVFLKSGARAKMVTEENTPFVMDQIDSRTALVHELTHGLGGRHTDSELMVDTSGERDTIYTTPLGSGYLSFMRAKEDVAKEYIGEEMYEHLDDQLDGLDLEEIREAEMKVVMTPSVDALEKILETNISSQN